jgi:hypothetical protein
MRIETLRPTSVATAKRAGRHGATGAFSGLLDSEAATTHGLAPAPPLHALTSLIGIQFDEGANDARRQRQTAMDGAEAALNLLTAVQRALAMGGLTVTHLQHLTRQLAALPSASGDPQLDEIRAEIHLRVAVEAAKLEFAHRPREALE